MAQSDLASRIDAKRPRVADKSMVGRAHQNNDPRGDGRVSRAGV